MKENTIYENGWYGVYLRKGCEGAIGLNVTYGKKHSPVLFWGPPICKWALALFVHFPAEGDLGQGRAEEETRSDEESAASKL